MVAQLRSLEKWSGLPIAATSAWAITAGNENALTYGFDVYLENPMPSGSFMAIVIGLTTRWINSTLG